MKLLSIILSLVFAPCVLAFRLDPMSATIEIKEGQSYFNFVIQNDTNQPLPIQISLYERKIKESGEDELKDTQELAAYPDQLIIPPDQKRSVKVSWLGKSSELKAEKAYRFVAEQLPLDLKTGKKDKSGIKMLLKYVAALYVNPDGSEAKVVCEVKKMELHCTNLGTKHQLLTIKKMTLEDSSTKVVYSKDDLRKINGENILAGEKRIFSLPIKDRVKNLKSPLKVDLKFE